jgi:hypothetical protein
VRPLRRSHVAGLGLLGIAAFRVAWEVGDVLRAPLAQLVARTPDDAWYYLTVARNVAAGRGASFDGQEPTNGFHPLWQLVEAALACVWKGTSLVRASLVAALVLTVAGVALWMLVLRRTMGCSLLAIGIAAVVVASPPALALLGDGMETPVVLVASATLAWALERWWRGPSVRTATLVGVTSGALVLARTSALVVIVVVPIAMVVASHRRVVGPPPGPRPRRQVAAWGASVAVVVAPWFAWSWAVVGSPAQSSSTVKWRWERQRGPDLLSIAHLRAAWRSGTEELWRAVRFGLPWGDDLSAGLRRTVEAVVVAAALVVLWRTARRSPIVVAAILPAALIAARLLVEVGATPSSIAPWYGAPLVVAAVVVLVVAATSAQVAVRARWAAWSTLRGTIASVLVGAVLAVGAVLVVTAPDGRPTGEWGRANLQAGQELASLGPARVGAYDAGVLGWVHPGVVNLDGLMRDSRSVDRLTSTDPARIPALERLDLLVGLMGPGDERVPSCAHPIWSSTWRHAIADARPQPVRIWDVRACRART